MTLPRALLLSCALTFTLSQCRCVTGCLRFFKDHASSGHHPGTSHHRPLRAVTVEQFIKANAHRGLGTEVLRSRFRVADENDDGWLTPEEVERHRVIAAQNKQRLRSD